MIPSVGNGSFVKKAVASFVINNLTLLTSNTLSNFTLIDFRFDNTGTKLTALGFSNGIAHLYQYSLSVAWNINTLSLYYTKDISFIAEDFRSICYSNDGTYLFLSAWAGSGSNFKTYRVSPTTAFGIQFSGYITSPSNAVDSRSGSHISTSGDKMFFVGSNSVYIDVFTLSTSFVVSNMSYSSQYYVGGNDVNSIYFNNDGKSVFIVRSNVIYAYNLSVAWDISSISFVGSKTLINPTSVTNFVFSYDGTKAYVSYLNTIYQLNV